MEQDYTGISRIRKRKKGRTKYQLPYKFDEFMSDYKKIIEDNLTTLIALYEEDKKEIKRLKEVKLGIQNIYQNYNYSNESMLVSNKSKTDQNEMWAITNFWDNSLISEPITYSLKTSDDVDDIAILNRYFTDVNKPVKDIKTINDVVTTGVGFQFITPTTKKNIDIEYEAPFHLAYLDNEKAFLVYSTGILEEELFGCVITNKVNEKEETIREYTIYMPGLVLVYEQEVVPNGQLKMVNLKKQPYNFQPIIEYTMTPERVGVITPVESLQDSQNDINSNQIDLVKQQSHPPLVLIDVELDVQPGESIEQTYKRIRETNTIAAKTTGVAQPKINYLEQTKDMSSSNETFERVHKAIYDISATPQASGNVTSGGDTGQARAFGNGWQNSFLRAKSYITFFTGRQIQTLKNILECCKLKGEKNPLKNTHATDIDVSFNTSVFDSILIKAQAYENLINSGVSVQEAAKSTKITKDPATFAKKVENQKAKDLADELALEQASTVEDNTDEQ